MKPLFLHEFTMWQRMAFIISVVLLGFSGSVLALFVRGMGAGQGAMAGFCFVSVLGVVQVWLVASEIAKARRLCGSTRNACYTGAQAKFRAVFLVGLCGIVGGFPLGLIVESAGAQGRFATVVLGGVLFSTIAALTVLPVVIAEIAE